MADRAIEQVVAKQAIQELSGTYMRGLDRLEPSLLLGVFHSDARTDYGFYQGGVEGFVDMAIDALRDHLANHHMLGQINISLEGDVAFGEVYFQAFHRIVDPSAGELDLMIAGRYADRYECRDGVWKIAFRSELMDWARTAQAADSYFEQAPDALRGARAPDDLTCRIEELRAL